MPAFLSLGGYQAQQQLTPANLAVGAQTQQAQQQPQLPKEEPSDERPTGGADERPTDGASSSGGDHDDRLADGASSSDGDRVDMKREVKQPSPKCSGAARLIRGVMQQPRTNWVGSLPSSLQRPSSQRSTSLPLPPFETAQHPENSSGDDDGKSASISPIRRRRCSAIRRRSQMPELRRRLNDDDF